MVISLEAGQKLLAMRRSVYEVMKSGMTSKQRAETEADIAYLESQIQQFEQHSDYGSYNETMEEIDNDEY